MTGAADTAAQFLPSLAPIYLVDYRHLKSLRFHEFPRALAIYTNTRPLTAVQARLVLRNAAEAVRDLQPMRIYKKIDSTLRGNIGAEVEVLLEVFGLELSFIVPAFPAQGRTTSAGTHLVHGRPIAKTEAARDPVTPITVSSLPECIRQQTRLQVAHIGTVFVDSDVEYAASEIDRLRSLGVKHYTFDATKQSHLDSIAFLALHRYPEVLLCGSAGLAESLAVSLANEDTPYVHEEFPPRDGNSLLICGSASEILRRQVSELMQSCICAREELAADILANPNCSNRWDLILQRASFALSQQDLILQIEPPGSSASYPDPGILTRGLARFVGQLVKQVSPSAFFISGGETASAVLDELRGQPIRLLGLIPGGMVKGILMGGPMSGRPVVIKAGAFGESDSLLNLYNNILRSDHEKYNEHS